MNLQKLRQMVHVYTRDTNSFVFTESVIDMYINEAIDKFRQIPIFKGMSYLEDSTDEVNILPIQWQFLIPLYASSRCFEFDERFYEAVEKRNEFESLLSDLMSEIEAGNLILQDDEGNDISNPAVYIEYVTNVYYNETPKDEDMVVMEYE